MVILEMVDIFQEIFQHTLFYAETIKGMLEIYNLLQVSSSVLIEMLGLISGLISGNFKN